MVSPAISLGATRYLNGLVDSVARASICSVTRIVPISAAIAAPIRPETIRPARTGPSSRVTDSTTTVGDRRFGVETAKIRSSSAAQAPCAVKIAVSPTTRQRVVADLDHLPEDQTRVVGRRQRVGDAADGEGREPTGRGKERQEYSADGRRQIPSRSGRFRRCFTDIPAGIPPTEAGQDLVADGAGIVGDGIGRCGRLK